MSVKVEIHEILKRPESNDVTTQHLVSFNSHKMLIKVLYFTKEPCVGGEINPFDRLFKLRNNTVELRSKKQLP